MIKNIAVKRRPGGSLHQGLFEISGKTYPCSLGRSGITVQKREGDGATPAGSFRLLYGFFRQDRNLRSASLLPLEPIRENHGWCDEVGHPAYNDLVTLPFSKSHEIMMRGDRLYDVCIVLDYNIHPKARNMGSAIFFHLTRPDMGATEGCVAIDPELMRKILPELSTQTYMHIGHE